jgi:hypothetical protein
MATKWENLFKIMEQWEKKVNFIPSNIFFYLPHAYNFRSKSCLLVLCSMFY